MISTALTAATSSAELPIAEYLSWSRISTFQQCPLKWHFKYQQRLPESNVAAGLVFGGAIHAAIECHYQHLLVGKPAPDISALMHAFDTSWRERLPATIRFGERETEASLRALGERILRVFQRSEFAVPQGKIVGIEEEIAADVVAGAPRLLARLDLLIESDSELRIIDFKTARSRWSEDDAQKSSTQLLLYGEAVRDVFPDIPLRLQFAVMTKTKEPTIEVHDIPSGGHETRRAVGIAQQVWKSIQASNISTRIRRRSLAPAVRSGRLAATGRHELSASV